MEVHHGRSVVSRPTRSPLRRLPLVLASLVATATATVALAAQASSVGGLPSTIKIGVVTSLSGASAASCVFEANAIRLAAHRAEHQRFFGKGVHIDVIFEDDQSTSDGAISGYQNLRSQGVVAILGPCIASSAEILAAQSDSTHIPEIVDLVSAADVVQHKYVFRGSPPQTLFATNTVKVLHTKGVKTVVVLHTTDNPDTAAIWNNEWSQQLKRDKIQVLQDFPLQGRPPDISAVIAQIAQMNPPPDAIGLDTLGTSTTVSYAQQLRQAGLNQLIFCQITCSYPIYYSSPQGSAGAGTLYATDFDSSINNPYITAFSKGWLAENGTLGTPTPSAAEGYNGAWRLFRAIKAAKSVKPDAILAALSAQKSTVGVSGPVRYIQGGHEVLGTGYVLFLHGGTRTVQTVPKECC